MKTAGMATKSRIPLQIYVTPEMRARLDAATEVEQISLGAFVRRVLALYLNDHGY